MDDYSMQPCKPGRCDEFFCHLAEWCSPQPLTDYEIAFMGVSCMSGWLQDEPSSTVQVARTIFPAARVNGGEIPATLMRSTGQALFDAGYTPIDRDALDTAWH